ncbi:MAG: hypothetical protein HOM34_06105 [Planctomycetes bacterium]|jgi:aspartate carbamoyltransferase catalytic subunit|nr:hypothetical protein [Planctomycetota bacterium]MBT4028304.1 hypothetical protein [Planctomycetota bacterium]MBT4560903.1 hypothetical protein [Planctomycetota bacterium]MBT5102100.1 hypothetical protein [Planctomycetota bacterium]MBT5120277.1 hypothetical protein [Planctomycetota bacterium]
MNLLPVLEGLHSAEAFHPAFLTSFFERVRELEQDPGAYQDALRGKLIATVFEEPSTRTRLSFEAAAKRLGGQVITVADPKTTSAAKGETLHDMAKVLGGYADLIVWRHASDGASRLASQAAGVPIVNGGDGRLGHPTQTLLDLYTLSREWGDFRGRTVALMGDLKNGRTARSLAWALAVLGVRIVLLPSPSLNWESSFERRILDRFDYRLVQARHPLFRSWIGSDEAFLLEPRGVAQGDLFPEQSAALHKIDAMYLTRLQDERGARQGGAPYPGVTPEVMADPLLSDCLLLHPLPRRGELPPTLDSDPRALYFEQAKMGPLVRMGVFLAFLRPDLWPLPTLQPLPSGCRDHDLGTCPNTGCITHSQKLRAPWRTEGRSRRRFLCAYCDALLPIDYIGCCSSRKVHPIHSPKAQSIRPENLRPFVSREDAERESYSWGS